MKALQVETIFIVLVLLGLLKDVQIGDGFLMLIKVVMHQRGASVIKHFFKKHFDG